MSVFKQPVCQFGGLIVSLLLSWSSSPAQSPSTIASSEGSKDLKSDFAGTRNQTETIRTLVYHEITALTTGPNRDNGQQPVLSDDGNRAAFAIAPGSGTPDNPNRIFVVNAEGSELREVDSYTSLCFCGSEVDLTADGSRVISSDGVQLRIAEADGSGAAELIAFNSGEIKSIRFAGDGSNVFFLLRRDTSVRGTNMPIERGLYVIAPSGGLPRQIVGPNQIAAQLGLQPNEVFPFDINGHSLDVSNNGFRIVFGVNASGHRLFGVNLDGTELHQILPAAPSGQISHAGISGDGSKILYGFCCGVPDEIGVIDFFGAGRRILATPEPGMAWPGSELVQLNYDASLLLLGSSGRLINADASGVLQLAARGQSFSSDPPPLLYDGLFVATMNSSATRFLYLAGDQNRVEQLAVLDIDPVNFGEAPSITRPSTDPAYVLTNGRSPSAISAGVSATNTVVRVNYTLFHNGVMDSEFLYRVMTDDGANGDATAGDGVFTYGSLQTTSNTEVGPRTVRINAEVRANDGRRHSTAVEFEPFEVVEQTAVAEQPNEHLPDGFVLFANYPNPFNPETKIGYELPTRSGHAIRIRLSILNTLGQVVRTLVDGERGLGYHEVTWDGKDELGNHVPSGIYYSRLQMEGFSQMYKMTLLR